MSLGPDGRFQLSATSSEATPTQSHTSAVGGEQRRRALKARERVATRQFRIASGGVLLVALVARLYQLGGQSFWVDEIGPVGVARSPQLLERVRLAGPWEPPLSHVFVRLALALPLPFETAARFPSAMFGVLEVAALMLVAYEATRRRSVTLLAGGLLAVAPFAVRYGQEVRYYTTLSALGLVTWWLLLRALRSGTWPWWIGYGVAIGVLGLVHPFTGVILCFQGVAVLASLVWRSRNRRPIWSVVARYTIGVLVAAVIVAPWVVYGASYWLTHDTKYTIKDPSG
jgi:4-amino-4-deoxy-L-arabinose transferase-like glycosyltransferase